MIEELERNLKSLLKGEFTSLYIDYNDHSTSYDTSFSEYGSSDWISDEERDKACEENSVWTLQWYPDTPVGSYRVKASSLSAIFKYLEEEHFK